MIRTADIFRAVLREGFENETSNIPDQIVDQMIEEFDVAQPRFVETPAGEKDLDYAQTLSLIHDILVFSGTVISVYRPFAKAPLTSEQKLIIEQIIKKGIEKERQ